MKIVLISHRKLSASMEINFSNNFKEIERVFSLAPNEIKRASNRAINKAAQRVRVDSGKDIADALEPRRGARREVRDEIKIVKSSPSTLTAYVKYNNKGFGVEKTRKATIRKVRGKSGRFVVHFKGHKVNNAFRIKGKQSTLMRSKGKIQRLFTYTLLQEARRANVFEESQAKALEVASDEIVRQVRLLRR